MNNISVIIYVLVALLTGVCCYQYSEYILYMCGIALSFMLLNMVVLYLYQGFKQKSMALMKFMGLNFAKDILWVVFWMFFIRNNSVLAIFIAAVFFLLSIPLYVSVLSGIGNNQKSDKNQS